MKRVREDLEIWYLSMRVDGINMGWAFKYGKRPVACVGTSLLWVKSLHAFLLCLSYLRTRRTQVSRDNAETRLPRRRPLPVNVARSALFCMCVPVLLLAPRRSFHPPAPALLPPAHAGLGHTAPSHEARTRATRLGAWSPLGAYSVRYAQSCRASGASAATSAAEATA